MCGILGSVNIDVERSVLDTIKHRGPDDSGIEKTNVLNNKITFGHRRLSIVDLSPAGHQPMYTACRNFMISYNGEIYNHKYLRKKLFDVNYNGHSDTETLLYYISRKGIRSLKNLNGIFAFAFLDIPDRKLYLARDPFGVKPLYYYHNKNKFVFSSEIKPILKLVNSDLRVDSLAEILRLRYNPSPDTLLKNVFKVRPGHYLTYDLKDHSLDISNYIEEFKGTGNIKFNQALEKYSLYFENSVKRQLMSDVEVGVLLSGGIDSALIARYADLNYHGRIKTFTVGFSEKHFSNEINEAKETASVIGTDHHDVIITDDDFENTFKKSISIIEEPLGTTSIIPMFYLNELVSNHVKVVLSGQGADEPLGGYSRYQGELYRKIIPASLLKSLSPYSRYIKNEKIFRGLNSLYINDIIKRFDNSYSLFSNDQIDRLTGYRQNSSHKKISYFYNLLELNRKDPVEALMALDCRMNLSDDLLLYTDKISMHFSIETRVPMLDLELIKFIESLPYKYRVKIGETKIIHKNFAKSSLPQNIINRPKKGFQSPTEKWFKGMKGKRYLETLTSKNCKFSSYIDAEEVNKIFNDHFYGRRNYEKQIFTLISIYHWMEIFL